MARGKQFSNDDLTYLDFKRKIHSTDAATLYLLDSGEQQWVPKSLIEDEDVDDGIVAVPTWWARKSGLD